MNHADAHGRIRAGSPRRTRWLALAPIGVWAALLAGAAQAQDRSVTIVLSDDPTTLEPCEATSDSIGRVTLHNVVEPLVQRSPGTGQLEPGLATEWEQVDELTWRFKLREGVTFHDGTPFNAEAAKYAIDRSMNPNLTCMVRVKFFGDRTLDVSVVDDYTIDVTTEEPDPILPLMMSTHTIYASSAPFEENTREAIGTGPYRVADWQTGQRIVLERYDDYWGEPPEVERAEYQWRSESSVRAAMVQQGEADLAPSIAVQDVTDEIGRAYPNSETVRLNLDALKPPLDDVRIRAAMNYAIDREALRGTVMSPDVMMATHLVLPEILGHNPNVEGFSYRPDVARALIDDAKADGVPVDTEIEFVGRTGHFPGVEDFQEAITAMLLDVGLNVRLQWYEAAQKNRMQVKPFFEDRPPQIIVDQHDNNMGDVSFTLYARWHSDGSFSKVSDPYLDWLIDYGMQSTGEERVWAFQRAHRRIVESVIADVMLFHQVGYAAVGPDIVFEPTLETNSAVRLSTIGFN
jgi:peptide/nickel transport system substrate-binding protein